MKSYSLPQFFILSAFTLVWGWGAEEGALGFSKGEGLAHPSVTEGESNAEFRYLSRLGSLDGPDLLEETPLDIVLDSLGRVVVTVATSTTPAVFDTLGDYLGRLGKVC